MTGLGAAITISVFAFIAICLTVAVFWPRKDES